MKKTIFTSVALAFGFMFNQSMAQLPTYELTAKNIHYISNTALEFDIYLKHTNPSVVSDFEYSTGQYAFDYNTAILNSGATIAGSITGSDFDPNNQPSAPKFVLVGGVNVLYLTAKLPGHNNAFVSSTGQGSLLVRARITATNGNVFNTNEAPNLTWRNGPANPLTKVSAWVNGVSTPITTAATHTVINSSTLDLTALIQGRYNNNNGFNPYAMVPDQVTVSLYDSATHALVESSTGMLDANGHGTFDFSAVSDATPYYVVISHKNSIETWSGNAVSFSSNTLTYDFTDANTKAYGNNMIQINNKWCIYTGDVSRDGFDDLTDLLLVYNAAVNFTTGNDLLTDLDGDDWVDVSDMAIADNNGSAFVLVRKPF